MARWAELPIIRVFMGKFLVQPLQWWAESVLELNIQIKSDSLKIEPNSVMCLVHFLMHQTLVTYVYGI